MTVDPETGPGSGRHPPEAARSWLATAPHLARRILPYAIGAVMFAVAVWVLHSTLARFDLADLQAELTRLTAWRLGLAVLFTGLSFVCLVGYEFSALGLVGKRLPLPEMALGSFTTQSISHSTGFAFLAGVTLRYNFYARRGLTLADVAKLQVWFTATFTLGVATLAGSVVLVEPWRLAQATGAPSWLWRLAAGTALSLVIAYVVWGAFFHRPLRWRGREFALPSTGATLTQIFFGVADLLAVAAALYVLLPAELLLSYAEVLAIFMTALVLGLLSHVPGSLGVFESAVILLVQPTEAQTLPLIGTLLTFRAVYYLLPLVCGVVVLTLAEMHRWRGVLGRLADRLRLDLGPGTPVAAAVLTFVAGLALVLGAMLPGAEATVPPHLHALHQLPDMSRAIEITAGLALLLLARGLALRLAVAWQWVLVLAVVALVASLIAGGSGVVDLLLLLVALLLFAARHAFDRPAARSGQWQSPAWILLFAVTLASSFWLIGRG
jgi:uncharacterized membrane protein YbhN (UPF0104 family)